ncbi:hypothetical protein RRG08_000607 [Elysia crispata]|uniref:PHD-type domain-containing protein n=1 Tax=Elysia crispata TaxID=231223 RepID=A0AAE0Y8C4_9GAST|nr:hypothetical protein RRG08_000607 [Elysia crispata]
MKFENLSPEKRQGLLLRAVCRPHVSVGTGLISSAELRDFSDFDDIILDSTPSLDVIQSYFSDNACSTLCEGVASRHAGIYKCGECKELDDLTQKMIMCEQFLRWYHFSCAGYRSRKKVPTWFCQECFSCEKTMKEKRKFNFTRYWISCHAMRVVNFWNVISNAGRRTIQLLVH